MSDQTYREPEVCDACGVAGEMGFIIKEGDEVAEVTIYANGKSQLEAEFAPYLALARQVNEKVQYEISPLNEDSSELKAKFQFEVSAEKLIFELRSRSLNK